MSDFAQPFSVPDPVPNDTVHLQWSPTNAIAYGWRAVWGRFEIVGVFLLAMLLGECLLIVGDVIQYAHGPAAVHMGFTVAGAFVSMYFQMTLARYCLKVARGTPTGVGELFAGGPYWTVVLATLVLAVGVAIGVVFLIVPGIILALGWGQYLLLLVDGRAAGPVESLRASWALTRGRKFGLFVLALLGAAVFLAGLLALGVGVLIALPILQMAGAYTYVMLTKQPLVRFGAGGPTRAGVS
jgi:uncharacterized membrane protein